MANSITISVHWVPVNCVHRNGEITGYLVQYREIESDNAQTIRVLRVESDVIISGLIPYTTYSIRVAAENTAGSGVFSVPVTVKTPDSE